MTNTRTTATRPSITNRFFMVLLSSEKAQGQAQPWELPDHPPTGHGLKSSLRDTALCLLLASWNMRGLSSPQISGQAIPSAGSSGSHLCYYRTCLSSGLHSQHRPSEETLQTPCALGTCLQKPRCYCPEINFRKERIHHIPSVSPPLAESLALSMDP